MALPEKWRPLNELERMRSEMDDVLERFGFDRGWFNRLPLGRELFREWGRAPDRPSIETRVEDGKFIVQADLPGVDPKDVDIKVIGGVLTIKGSREEKREGRKPDFFRREISYGSFERSIPLPEGVRAEDLKATYRNGVLELAAPLPKEATPKEVKIQIDGAKG